MATKQGPQNHRSSAKNSLRSLKIFKKGHFHFYVQPSELSSLLNSLGGKTVINIQVDPQTTEILSTKLNVMLWVREWVCELHLFNYREAELLQTEIYPIFPSHCVHKSLLVVAKLLTTLWFWPVRTFVRPSYR